MKKNVGAIDKVIRILIAVVIVVLFFAHIITGALGIILLAVAAILLLTSFISLCPIYLALGISTGKKKE